MDGRVLDVNWLVRFCIVHFAILPLRPKHSAEAYQKIWTPAGSPLVVISRNVQAKLGRASCRSNWRCATRTRPSRKRCDLARARRGRDAADSAVPALCDVELRDRGGAGEGSRAPAGAANAGAGAAAVFRAARLHRGAGGQRGGVSEGGVRPSCCSVSTACRSGICARPIQPGRHCLAVENCCETASPAHATCYRAQCFKTVAAFVGKAGVPHGKYSVAFQSRLGRDPG